MKMEQCSRGQRVIIAQRSNLWVRSCATRSGRPGKGQHGFIMHFHDDPDYTGPDDEVWVEFDSVASQWVQPRHLDPVEVPGSTSAMQQEENSDCQKGRRDRPPLYMRETGIKLLFQREDTRKFFSCKYRSSLCCTVTSMDRQWAKAVEAFLCVSS